MLRGSVSLIALACAAAPALAQEPVETEQATFAVETVAEGLGFPWSLAFLPDGGMLVTERDGRLRVIEADGTLREDPVAGLPDDLVVVNQGGLLEVALHPEFADNRLVYFSYSEGTEDANRTALARGRLNADMTALENVEDIFHVNFDKRRGLHFGGRILFEDSDTLLLTLGEGGIYTEEAQNPENHLGTVVRLNDDGSIPEDNPFVGPDGRADEIWTWGHRNVQGIDRNPATGSVWTHEHGARGGDEINILEAGANYGWPEATYGINYDGTVITENRELEGTAQPIWYWNPSIAPAGMAFYTGEAFEHWNGDLFVAALAGQQLQRLEVIDDRVISVEPLLEDMQARFRYVRSGPDGAVYVLTDMPEGQVLRLVPAETEEDE
ncbi:glucose dehydrogenase [Marinicauda salina]|uniref:Glucose dehydrogenase n=1 Tax=Marinicauda salina TaxID=2135793 RepID=A0A2U2BXP6_9PROT|nr:PQQ-dependent sugar dehydrogenase [Marinicauda salina]PWE18785.1 glucose dehydrogenase [Marinicauda salina]